MEKRKKKISKKVLILCRLHGMVLLFENPSMLEVNHPVGNDHTSGRGQKIKCCTFVAKSEKEKH